MKLAAEPPLFEDGVNITARLSPVVVFWAILQILAIPKA